MCIGVFDEYYNKSLSWNAKLYALQLNVLPWFDKRNYREWSAKVDLVRSYVK